MWAGTYICNKRPLVLSAGPQKNTISCHCTTTTYNVVCQFSNNWRFGPVQHRPTPIEKIFYIRSDLNGRNISRVKAAKWTLSVKWPPLRPSMEDWTLTNHNRVTWPQESSVWLLWSEDTSNTVCKDMAAMSAMMCRTVCLTLLFIAQLCGSVELISKSATESQRHGKK